jgi:hypothetical protein
MTKALSEGVQAKRYVDVQNVFTAEALACGDGLKLAKKPQPKSA